MTDTVLTLTGMGIAPYSARGLRQTLSVIGAAASMRRTINGVLVDLSSPRFRKYASSIQCTDQNAPALNGVWPGMILTVECICELAYETGGSPDRPVVPGSIRIEGEYTFFRPILEMRVMTFSNETDEWNASNNWSMELEEV